MSYSEGTYIRPRYPLVYFDDIHSKSIEGVEEEQRECQREVYAIREKLAMLIAGTPKDMMTEEDLDEYGNSANWITAQLNEIEEELQDALRKYGRLELYEQLLDEWEDGTFSTRSNESIYDDVNLSSKAGRAIVFPEEKYANENEKMQISLGSMMPPEKSIDELFSKGMENIEMTKPYSDKMSTLVYAIVDGQLFTTYTGQCFFKDSTGAIEAIKHRLNISLLPYTNARFINHCPEFFKSLQPYVNEDELEEFNGFIENPDSLGSIISPSYNKFYDIVNKAYNKFLLSKIQLKKISL